MFKRSKKPASASELMENVLFEQPESPFNMKIIAPVVAAGLRGEDVAPLIMNHPIRDYLTMAGLEMISRDVGACMGDAEKYGIRPEQFDNYLNDPS